MKIIWSAIVATVLTAMSYGTALYMGWTTEINWLEAFSVWTSYSCTFLCVFQSRQNYWIGAISVAALCVLFYQQSLYGSMALQVYLLPVMAWGWFRWGKDDDTRPVTRLGWDRWTLGYGAFTVIAIGFVYWLNTKLGGAMAFFDSSIFVASVLAQALMDNKKIENWIVWLLMDILSVYVYWTQGLYIVAIQMGLFTLNAVWGFIEWRKTEK